MSLDVRRNKGTGGRERKDDLDYGKNVTAYVALVRAQKTYDTLHSTMHAADADTVGAT